MNDTFFKNFPSLNSNSKENRKHRQIVCDYKDYLSACKSNNNGLKAKSDDEKFSTSQNIFQVDERNQKEEKRRLESKRNYQKILQEQISEARHKRELEKIKEEQDRFLAERRLQSQIAKLQEESRLHQKLNPRISLPEHETSSNMSLTKDDRNHVYQYFSKTSPKVDSALFGYRRFFDDLQIDDRNEKELPERSHTFPAHCMRCHKSLEKLCRTCDDEERISTMDTSKSIESFTRSSKPFSFNYDTNSIFNRDENILRNYLRTYNQMTNYQKLYGDLRNRNLRKEVAKPDPIDDLLKNAQYAVITGYATSLLKSDEEVTK